MAMKGLTAAALAAALSASATATAADPPKAVATTGMVADVARTVAGDCLAVATLMGPGIDPHLFKPSAGDVRAMAEADILLYSGHNLEGQLGAVLAKLEGRKPVVAVAERAIAPEALIRAPGSGHPDPHVWMDAALWAGTAAVIAEAFAPLAPDCAAAMAARAADYGLRLAALHDWARESIASIPEGQRVLVTAHDAFAYFGRAYGIAVIGIQGVSTEAEAGIADIRAVVDTVVASRIPAIFVESTINPRTVAAVVAAAGARGHALAIGPELFSDAMGEDGTAAGTYIGMVWSNTRSIAEALGGTPAPLPPALADWARRWTDGG